MLTLDDLEQFGQPEHAHLFAPPTGACPDADRLARMQRIAACLNFCQNIPDDYLIPGGAHAARAILRRACRCEQRAEAPDPAALLDALDTALLALGAIPPQGREAAGRAGRRHALERAIRGAAGAGSGPSVEPALLGAFAAGYFELLPSSEPGLLVAALGSGADSAGFELDFALEVNGMEEMLRVHLRAGNLDRCWQGLDGCCLSRNGNPAVFLPAADGLVEALLGGLSADGGHALCAWAHSLGECEAA